MRRGRMVRLSYGPSENEPPPGWSSFTPQPRVDRNGGSVARISITAVLPEGLLTQNSRFSKAASRACRWPPPGTGITARNPRLLSQGTSLQSGVGPMAEGSPLTGSLLARSPATVALINMHSWPGTSGCQSNGPAIASPPEGKLGIVRAAVVIGFQSSGQTRPAAGRLCQPWTVTLTAVRVPRFFTRT